MFPLLFVGSSAMYMVLAVPMGRLADLVGRGRVLIGGYALLAAVYAALLLPMGGWLLLVVVLGLLGAYYGATDGVLMALGSAVVPEELRGSGLALLGTATSIARLVASLLFGALWTVWGIHTAIVWFGVALLAAIALAALLFARTHEHQHA
jgi:MFS family permease